MKISVIIPVYNAEYTIERCVESIVSNQEKSVEIILIEDCSKDNSWEKCKILAEKFSNVRCFHNEKNRGVSYTRNRGLKEATGQYIMFVDSDDWVDISYIDEFSCLVDAFQTEFAICGYVNHDEKYNGLTEIFGWNEFEGIKKFDIKSIIKDLHDKCLLQQLWNKIFVVDLIREKNIQFDESISIGEDFRFILDYIKECEIKTVYLMNKPLYQYMRDQEGSLMFHVGYENIDEPLKNLKTLYEIMGMGAEEIQKIMISERKRLVELYAYLIYHNSGMAQKEKKRLILKLDMNNGKEIYQKNKILFYKERIKIVLEKLRLIVIKTRKNKMLGFWSMHKHLLTMYIAPAKSGNWKNVFITYFLLFITKSDGYYRYKFLLNLRKYEYLEKKKGLLAKVRRLLCARKYHYYENILGYVIEPGVLGPDAHLYHKGSVIIHGNAKVGANVHIHGDCCIGIANTGSAGVPMLGNNVDIGSGAKILGEIYIADNIVIGANSVVTKSFYEEGITIAGIPAKRIK